MGGPTAEVLYRVQAHRIDDDDCWHKQMEEILG
jgi:hypothetical protein